MTSSGKFDFQNCPILKHIQLDYMTHLTTNFFPDSLEILCLPHCKGLSMNVSPLPLHRLTHLTIPSQFIKLFFFNLPSLTYLHLYQSEIHFGNILYDSILVAPHLTQLIIEAPILQAETPIVWTQLQNLTLKRPHLYEQIVPCLSHLKQLKTFTLMEMESSWGWTIQSDMFPHSLEELRLHDCQISFTTNQGLTLTHLTSLKLIEIIDNWWNENDYEAWKQGIFPRHLKYCSQGEKHRRLYTGQIIANQM
jgi:hypothetical protein